MCNYVMFFSSFGYRPGQNKWLCTDSLLDNLAILSGQFGPFFMYGSVYVQDTVLSSFVILKFKHCQTEKQNITALCMFCIVHSLFSEM